MAGEKDLRKKICRLDENDVETTLPSVKEVQKYFASLLAKRDINTKEKWISKIESISHFDQASKKITKFLLIIASDRAATDPEDPTRLVLHRNSLNILNDDAWKSEAFKTIEHIVPQHRGTGWLSEQFNSFYDPDNSKLLLHGLGNLTLCPSIINSSLSNESWDKKRIAYAICSCPADVEAEKLVKKHGKIFSNLSLRKYRADYLPMLKHLAAVETEGLTEDFIKNRGRQICNLAWVKLTEWLGLSNEETEQLEAKETPELRSE